MPRISDRLQKGKKITTRNKGNTIISKQPISHKDKILNTYATNFKMHEAKNIGPKGEIKNPTVVANIMSR